MALAGVCTAKIKSVAATRFNIWLVIWRPRWPVAPVMMYCMWLTPSVTSLVSSTLYTEAFQLSNLRYILTIIDFDTKIHVTKKVSGVNNENVNALQ